MRTRFPNLFSSHRLSIVVWFAEPLPFNFDACICIIGAIVDHGIDAFLAFTTGVAVTSTVEPALSTSRMMLAYSLFFTAWFCAQWGEHELGTLDQRGITEEGISFPRSKWGRYKFDFLERMWEIDRDRQELFQPLACHEQL